MKNKVAAHMYKQKGGGGGLSAHIERRIKNEKGEYIKFTPKSVTRPERAHLNKDYILKDGQHRSAAIEERIRSCVKRKVSDNQVKCLAFIITSNHDKMGEIERSGRLDEWANDQIEWFKKEFGEENVVGAALHMDEKTPHLHVSVVPIVYEQRKRTLKERLKDEKGEGKRYKEKEPGARLSAKDICNVHNLRRWQDELGALNAKWGMERGEVGSSAKHINPADYNAIEDELMRLQERLDAAEEETTAAEAKAQQAAKEAAIWESQREKAQEEANKAEEERKAKAAALNKENGSTILSGAASVMGAIGEGAKAAGRGMRELWQVSTNGKLEGELKATKENTAKEVEKAVSEERKSFHKFFSKVVRDVVGVIPTNASYEKLVNLLNDHVKKLEGNAASYERRAIAAEKEVAALKEGQQGGEQQQEQRGWSRHF